ncbi:MAG: hypothetical protein IJH07_08315, partial [Ruminococcus sp.]|nr:hypothetical protein [Ruminococcus sp.]
MLKRCGRSFISLLLVFLLITSLFTVSGSAASWIWGKSTTTKTLTFQLEDGTSKTVTFSEASSKFANAGLTKYATVNVNDNTEKTVDVTVSSRSQADMELTFKVEIPNGYIMRFDYQVESTDGIHTQTCGFVPPGSTEMIYADLEDGNSYMVAGSLSSSGSSNNKSVFRFYLDSSQKTHKAHLTNITLEKAVYRSVTVKAPTGGSVTANDSEVSATTGDVVFPEVGSSSGLKLTPAPDSGYTFAGYKINDSELLIAPTVADYTYFPDVDDSTVEAVFIPATEPSILVGNTTGYKMVSTLREAVNEANENGYQYIIPITDITVPDDGNGSYDIPSGVTLVIPNDAERNVYRTEPNILYNSSGYYTKNPSRATTLAKIGPTVPYVTMTVSENVIINVASGAEVSVGGIQWSPNGGGSACVKGGYGLIIMKEGAKLNINNGAFLYAWGFVVSDPPATSDSEPSVICESGATVYEMFQITDYSGGSIISDIVPSTGGCIFPFSQYYVQNVEAKMKLNAGSREYVVGALTAAGSAISTGLMFIGDAGMFTLNAGCAIKYYDYEQDKLICRLDENADAAINPMALNVGIELNTANFQLPISNIGVEIAGNSTVEINQDLQLFPDSYVTLDENSSLDINCNVYVADKATIDGHVMGNVSVKPMVFSATRYIETGDGASHRTANSLDEPYIINDGEVTINPTAKGNDTVGSLNLVGEGGTITGTGTITNNAADSVSPGDIKLISFYYDTDKKRQAGKQEPDPGENDTQCDDIEAMGMAYSYDETRDIWHTDTVSIYFVDSDDEEHYEFIEANYGDTVTAPTWTQEGYKLTWVNGSDVEDTYKPGDSFEAIRFAYYWTEWTEKTAETYTVTWKNDDGTVLETDTDVAEGATPSYGGETPAKESTAQYSYTFAGWSTDGETVIDPLPEVTGDVTYIAVYTETTRTYTVTWTDEFGSELETDYNVPYGTMPIFNSMAPTKDQTEQYTYSFAGWSTDGENVINPLPEVTKDVTYTAQFTQTLRKYMITFLADEFEDHVLQSTEVEYGAVPVYTGEEPTKEAVAAYFFDFAGWSTDGETVIDPLPAVTGEATYRPAFTATLNTYTITWNNWDGSLLEKDENVPFDTMPEYNGDTPTRPADDTYTYTFDGWDPAVESVGGDKIYTAKFTSKLKPTEGYYVVGNFTSDPDGRQWRPGTDFKLDTIEENELYVIRNVALTTSSEFKILYSYDGTDRTTWYPGGDNYGAGGQITADGSYDIYFRKNGDGNTNLGWYEGYIMVLNAGDELPTEPEPTEPPAAGYYVVGNFTTWGLDEAYLMTQVDGADPDLYVFRDLELTTTSQFKVVYTPNGTSQTWYPSGMWNNYGESGEITADGTYDVYFRPDGEGSTDDGWHYGYILAIPAGTELPTEPPTEPPAPTDPPIAPGYYIVGTFTDNEIDETYMMTLNEDQTDYTEYVFTDLALTTDARFKVVGVDENGNQTTYPGAYADPYGAWGQIKSDDTYTVYFRPDGNGDGAWYNGYIKVPGNFVPVTPGYYVIGTFTDWQLDQDYMMTLNEDADVTEYVLRNIHLTKTDDTTDMFKVVYTSNGYETNTWYPSGMGNNYGQNGEIPVDAAYDIYFRPNGQDGWFHDYIFAQDLTPYTVIWRNWNNEVLETDENMLRGMTPEYNGATPTRDATAQYTYTFDGWYPVPTTVQGDMVFRAEFTPTVNKYTIQFVDEDGTELQSSEVEYGAVPVYTSETPTKEATAQYTYAFDGWKDNTTTYGKDDPLPEVTGDQTYTAVYKDVTNTYTVIWQNEDGTELEKDEYVPYGTTPSYDGATPTKAATAQYTYTFKDWDPAVSDVTGDVTYKATYTETVNKYIITWKDGNGDTLKTEQVAYGETPAYDGETPTKTATAQYTYTFNNTWSPEIAEVTENATYTAQFDSTVNKYTITWIDGNGDTLKTEQVAYGETPAYTGATPTKTATAQYSYTFNNTWSPAIISVTGDATYTAQFDQTVNEYTITWIDGNGDTLKTEQVAYGEIPAYTGETPTKTATAEFTYTFNNTWTPEIVSVTGDATYTAQFAESARKYTITWKNSDTTLKTEEIAYGEIPEYTGETPTMEGDDQYTYFFTGWTPAVVPVTGDATYTAVFGNTTNTYTITWLDEDGTELKKENVAYGSIPSYGENPTKEADVQYTYTFAGWTPFVAPVTGDATYKATYTSTVNEYTITWKNGEDIIKTEQVAYGETPAYTGETPAKDSTASTDYTFSGWDPEAAPVTGDATYTAQFTESVRKYTVTWKNGDTTLKTEEVAYGEIPVYDGETPTKAADAQYTYTFNNTWTPEIVAVTEDATYTAQFDSTVNKYTITWIDGNGDTLKTEQVAYGETPAYTGETPTKTA